MSKIAAKTVLIIDDCVELLESIGEDIRELGYNTVLASSVEAAYPRLANGQTQIDIVIADVQMPDREYLERMLASSRLPVIRMSGAVHQIPNLMLRKPFNNSQLMKALEFASFLTSSKKAA